LALSLGTLRAWNSTIAAQGTADYTAAAWPTVSQPDIQSDIERREPITARPNTTPCADCEAGLVLWNRLGSEDEVAQSAVGANGTIIGSEYAFEPAQLGNGYVRKAVGGYVQFPASVLDNLHERGAIELWIVPKVSQPAPYEYGVFGLVGGPYGHYGVPPESNIELIWGDTITGQGMVGMVRFDERRARTPDEPVQFVADVGVPFHAAMAWDIDGIDGTADTIRVYRDGVLVGQTSETWNPNGTEKYDVFLGYGPDEEGYDKFISDDLRIWDYAKTDFPQSPTAVDLVSFTAVGEEDAVVVRWVTAYEENTFGYQLYRSSDGMRSNAVPVTEELIMSQGTSGGDYTVVDQASQAGIAYTYWLDEVDIDGAISELATVTVDIVVERIFIPYATLP
jgi:hypothetical protein